jgi:hypothetical protein
MMNLRTAFAAGRPQLWRRRTRGEGGGALVACASAMPLIVLAVAVAADYESVARFTTHLQLAADAASLAQPGRSWAIRTGPAASISSPNGPLPSSR